MTTQDNTGEGAAKPRGRAQANNTKKATGAKPSAKKSAERAAKKTAKRVSKKTPAAKTTAKQQAGKARAKKAGLAARKTTPNVRVEAPAVITPPEVEFRQPRNSSELAVFLEKHLELHSPREPVVVGHATPMAYLCHAFFEDSVPRDCVVWANRGGGKTYLAAVATLLDLVFKPGIEIRILGGSLEQAARMHEHLCKLLEIDVFKSLIKGKVTERRVTLRNDSRVELLAQSQTSVRGTRVQKLRCDEVELIDPAIWEAAQLITREKTCGNVFVPGSIECLSTMHRPFGIMQTLVKSCTSGSDPGVGLRHENAEGDAVDATRHLFRWGVLDVLGECDDTHECASCALEPACSGRAKVRDAAGTGAGHISVSEAKRLMKRVGAATWDSEMLCLRPSRSDTVLPEFDLGLHVVAELPESRDLWTWVCGMDFGFRAPTVVLWAGVDADGVLWVVDERIVAGEVLDRHADTICNGQPRGAGERWPQPSWVGIDPAGHQRSGQTGVSDATLLKARGLRVRDRRLGLIEGLSLLRTRLAPADGPPRLWVHRRCGHLIEALETYHFPEDQPESAVPVKDGPDHAVDALRYLVQNLDRPYRVSKQGYL